LKFCSWNFTFFSLLCQTNVKQFFQKTNASSCYSMYEKGVKKAGVMPAWACLNRVEFCSFWS
jgi:hypothetical protein